MRKAARFATLAGAFGSEVFFFGASESTPLLLRIILAGWVFFPFFAAAAIDLVVSKNWVPWVRSTLFGVMLAIAVASLTVYGADLRPAGASAGFLFVAVPAASLGLLAGMLLLATLVSGRQSS